MKNKNLIKKADTSFKPPMRNVEKWTNILLKSCVGVPAISFGFLMS